MILVIMGQDLNSIFTSFLDDSFILYFINCMGLDSRYELFMLIRMLEST